MVNRGMIVGALIALLATTFTACATEPASAPAPDAAASPAAVSSASPSASPSAAPTTTPTPTPSAKPTPEPKPSPTSGPRLLGQGDSSDDVRELQARLKQIGWFNAGVTGFYGDVTAEAVSGFQGKRGIAVTGLVDQTTLDRLHAMTREPTEAELTDAPPPAPTGKLDPRCLTGRVMCIDKSTSMLRWVVGGTVQMSVEVRFGSQELPTREGQFSVFAKSRDHVSSIYKTPMPFAMFFSGGQAVHYSPDFAANGYNGASHGCVNVRDHGAITSLYDQVGIGDAVVIYWS
ncbi:L,D-transpeptidase family protein [Nocardioides albus]|uniref:Peptidoglycan hydrolase-like protein with peptidoglycan-binding domain n=2 Tax=Nocardioides albus TaxID=1841 RepID=A0A7W5F8H3_9ACTN|nr:L,D-transpeptidase family protein [Nocardioides albus]MBB3088932.1 peptidoglycan hydrolase-like protein with peptidoglycan-binding domain [Nocardioides albus]